jgi:hypothetical protein
VRVDKFTSDGHNEERQAERFPSRAARETLSQYKKNRSGGHTKLFPVSFFGVPYKTIADTLATRDSIKFLSQLQAAVASSYPPNAHQSATGALRSFQFTLWHQAPQ